MSAARQAAALALAQAVMEWWKDHEFDATPIYDGEFTDERNVYEETPAFVVLARAYLENHKGQ